MQNHQMNLDKGSQLAIAANLLQALNDSDEEQCISLLEKLDPKQLPTDTAEETLSEYKLLAALCSSDELCLRDDLFIFF